MESDKIRTIIDEITKTLEVMSERTSRPETQKMLEQFFDTVDELSESGNLEELEKNAKPFASRLAMRTYFDEYAVNEVHLHPFWPPDGGKSVVEIWNYDYKTYLWAKGIYDKEISNFTIIIPAENLTPGQRQGLYKKAVNGSDVDKMKL